MEMTVEQQRALAIAAARARAAESGEEPPSVAADVAKSAGVGLARGGIGLLGLPGDIRALAGVAADKLGVPQNVQTAFRTATEINPVTRLLATGPTSQDIQSQIEGQTGEFYKPQTVVGEYAKTIGEFAPGAIAGPGGIARRALIQSLLPAAASETAGQVARTHSPDKESYARIVAALATPAAVSMGARAITPFPSSPERQRMVDLLANEGVGLTAGQATGSRGLRFAESHLSEIPGGGGGAASAVERQKEQFTGAALRRAGENETRVTPGVMDQAFSRIGQQFDDLSARNTLTPDQKFAQDLTGAVQNYHQMVNPSQRAPVVDAFARELIQAVQGSGGTIPGTVYQAMRSRLDRIARSARSDPQLSEALFGIRNSLDDAMERSMLAAGRAEDVAAWQNARREYRNILVLERAAASPGEDAALGLLSPAQLRSATVGQNRRDYVRGDGDFADLARAGAATMLPLPNSGTPARAATQVLPAMVGGGLGAAFGGWPGASMGAAAASAGAAALPPLMGRAIMSQPGQAYLGNQLLPAMAPGTARERVLGALMRAEGVRARE